MLASTFLVSVACTCAVLGDSLPQLNADVKYWNAANPSGKPETMRGQGYFDVLSEPLTALYAQSFWPFSNQHTPIPADIVAKYSGKVMAITGYEATTVEYVDGVEKVVAAYDLYNHHYVTWIYGQKSSEEVREAAAKVHGHGDMVHGMPKILEEALNPTDGSFPKAQLFSEGNGNEYRVSWHGYYSGYAQLIDSPAYVLIKPMVINTRNPNPGQPAPLPRTASAFGTPYSALAECPCTDRPETVKNISAGTIGPNKFRILCDQELIAANNTACSLATYMGGLRCCNHLTVLLDADQIINVTNTYYHKFRFFYEDYQNTTRNLVRTYFMMAGNEYDVPGCPKGVAPGDCPIHTIVRNITGAGLGYKSRSEVIMLGPHQHVGSIGMDLINLDTNEIICRTRVITGKSKQPGDELGYAVGMPPCTYGHDGSTPAPPIITPTTRLQSIAYYNTTHQHYGVMSYWQGRLAAL